VTLCSRILSAATAATWREPARCCRAAREPRWVLTSGRRPRFSDPRTVTLCACVDDLCRWRPCSGVWTRCVRRRNSRSCRSSGFGTSAPERWPTSWASPKASVSPQPDTRVTWSRGPHVRAYWCSVYTNVHNLSVDNSGSTFLGEFFKLVIVCVCGSLPGADVHQAAVQSAGEQPERGGGGQTAAQAAVPLTGGQEDITEETGGHQRGDRRGDRRTPERRTFGLLPKASLDKFNFSFFFIYCFYLQKEINMLHKIQILLQKYI